MEVCAKAFLYSHSLFPRAPIFRPPFSPHPHPPFFTSHGGRGRWRRRRARPLGGQARRVSGVWVAGRREREGAGCPSRDRGRCPPLRVPHAASPPASQPTPARAFGLWTYPALSWAAAWGWESGRAKRAGNAARARGAAFPFFFLCGAARSHARVPALHPASSTPPTIPRRGAQGGSRLSGGPRRVERWKGGPDTRARSFFNGREHRAPLPPLGARSTASRAPHARPFAPHARPLAPHACGPGLFRAP
jgi:hypothetical protein